MTVVAPVVGRIIAIAAASANDVGDDGVGDDGVGDDGVGVGGVGNAYVHIHHIVRNPTIQPRDICRHVIGRILRIHSVNRSAVRSITGCGR